MKNIVFITLFIVSCGHHSEIRIEQVDISNSIKSENKVVSDIPANCYRDIVLKDTMLILFEECGKNLFQIYSSNSYKPLCQFGTKGRGPLEFQSPCIIQETKDSSLLLIHDMAQFKLSRIRLCDLIQNTDTIKGVKDDQLPRMLTGIYNLNIADSNYISSSMRSGSDSVLFSIYNINSERIKNMGYLPHFPIAKTDDPFITPRTVYTNNIRISERHNSIVVAFKFLNLINFYDLNGNLKKSCSINALKEPIDSRKIDIGDHTIVTVSSMYATPDFCYLLWCGRLMPEINSTIPSRLIAFDWQGNLHQVYDLNNNPQSIAIDEKKQQIFGVVFSDNKELTEIHEYRPIPSKK